MPKRTCSVDGCEKPHVARGFCRRHYRFAHEMHDATCVTCGVSFQGHRATAKYCSEECRSLDYMGPRTKCALPSDHPVRVEIERRKVERRSRRRPQHRVAECHWCGAEFDTTRSRQVMCSRKCSQRAKRNARRGRAAGSSSHYTWTEVMRVFLTFGRCCAYCERPIVGQPDPDHVVPLSKGGSNSITNILPCCRLCNSDKRDLLLDEWAADRERRGLPPRTTAWAIDDPRVRHLTCLLDDAHAA